MSEIGGLDSAAPDEGGGGGSEQLSEQAKQRFAGAAAAAQQARKQEKKSKKSDKRVAAAIKKYLQDKRSVQLSVLIARLSSRNCPSIFIVAVLSLIDEEALSIVQDYLGEHISQKAEDIIDDQMALTTHSSFDAQANQKLVIWITRLQMVLSVDPDSILMRLMIDEKNLDSTILQLTMFVLQQFFLELQREAPFEKLQPLTASILQTVFEPFIGQVRKRILEERTQAHSRQGADDDDDE